MKPSKNEHTGDFLVTGASSDAYRTGWDMIFGKREVAFTEKLVINIPENKTFTQAFWEDNGGDEMIDVCKLNPEFSFPGNMPNPTEADLNDPVFEAIWQVIKSWDIKVPEYYDGYCGGNGSHVMLILNGQLGY